eukprot:CAMPEP_0201696016 /NCGR_PEP_ID=MMETSP0578-20130828/7808_1 /ASSEMBLY_ACC=CAM_ASM_000663 /TAXON_ID=267565 /ORGANISM="Skeletonema grethea, Strain CCMP 1804" /LENGTH=60 /DNA_ID=CAMNT_0048181951 /DNA_START=317 /DNA_END=499 /DNA_ORIENTATION=-
MECDDESSDDGKKIDSNSNSKDGNKCRKMCGSKKNEVLDCEERIVQKWLRKEGIDDWYAK